MGKALSKLAFIQTFMHDVMPQTLGEIDVQYNHVNMRLYCEKLAKQYRRQHSAKLKRDVQTLCDKFPLLSNFVTTCKRPKAIRTAKRTTPTPLCASTIYIGLNAQADILRQELEQQMLSLQKALVYANMRTANSDEIILPKFKAQW